MSNRKSTLTEGAVGAMRSAVRKVIEDHRRRNRPLAVWERERVVFIDADALPAVKEPRNSYGTEKQDGKRDVT